MDRLLSMPGGTRTPDTRLRRPVLYPTELRTHKPFAIAPAENAIPIAKAGDGNRTHISSLEG